MAIPQAIKKISDTLWEIPTSYKPGMRVPARIYASRKLLEDMDDGVFEQVTNVAALPGILSHAFCMPDGHWGYGFPIGGMAAMDPQSGVISPGGIGFDVNCGMRLIRTSLTLDEVKPHLRELVDKLFSRVPAGVGSKGFVRISHDEFREVVEKGAGWCIGKGYAEDEDLDVTEESGCVSGADASKVSKKAVDRGFKQIGTLGSGNHYLEIQVVKPENVFDRETAGVFGITLPGQIVVMLHCGSRGFGHQVATDYLHIFLDAMQKKYNLKTPERELACAPFQSPEGQDYFAAMKCAINMSYVNRQVIFHNTTAHGSGRTMSRRKAKKMFNGKKLRNDLETRGIYIRTASYSGLAEEVGLAYKNIDDVVEATEQAGLSKRVVRFVPIGNIKG